MSKYAYEVFELWMGGVDFMKKGWKVREESGESKISILCTGPIITCYSHKLRAADEKRNPL